MRTAVSRKETCGSESALMTRAAAFNRSDGRAASDAEVLGKALGLPAGAAVMKRLPRANKTPVVAKTLASIRRRVK